LKPIVWIVSYPKSGNTWMRFLLRNYLSGASLPWHSLAPHAATRSVFDTWSGVESSDLPDALVTNLRSQVYRAMAASTAKLLPMKVHDAWALTSSGQLFPRDITRGVIYLVRHPYDVAVSLAHHWDRSFDAAIGLMCDDTALLHGAPDTIGSQLPQQLGSWSGHVSSWIEKSNLPCTTVRFEELLQRPEAALSRVLAAIGIAPDSALVAAAVRDASFERLRDAEEQGGFPERFSRSTPFFRGGRAGDGLVELNDSQRGALWAAHHRMMRMLDYDDGSPRAARAGTVLG
jgi:aryl sulfotransferase